MMPGRSAHPDQRLVPGRHALCPIASTGGCSARTAVKPPGLEAGLRGGQRAPLRKPPGPSGTQPSGSSRVRSEVSSPGKTQGEAAAVGVGAGAELPVQGDGVDVPPAEAEGSIQRTLFPDSSAPTDCRFRGGARIIGVQGSRGKAAGPESGNLGQPGSTAQHSRGPAGMVLGPDQTGRIVFLAGDVRRIAESTSVSNRSGAIIRKGVPAGNQPGTCAAGTRIRRISGGAAPACWQAGR